MLRGSGSNKLYDPIVICLVKQAQG